MNRRVAARIGCSSSIGLIAGVTLVSLATTQDAGHGGAEMMAELCLRNDRGLTDRPDLLDEVGRSSAAQAKAALACSRIYDLRRLVVVQDGERIVLRGRVCSFYHMQLAQEVVRNATDGAEVINAIRVVYQPERREAELDRAG